MRYLFLSLMMLGLTGCSDWFEIRQVSIVSWNYKSKVFTYRFVKPRNEFEEVLEGFFTCDLSGEYKPDDLKALRGVVLNAEMIQRNDFAPTVCRIIEVEKVNQLLHASDRN